MAKLRSSATTVLLVHGAFHGAWSWNRLLDPLRSRGITPVAMDLPGHGDSEEPFTDLFGDSDAVKSKLDDIGERSLLVGHSYGGMVINDAGTHPLATGLVCVSGFIPKSGESLAEAGTDGSQPDDDERGGLVSHTRFENGRELMRLEGEGLADVLFGSCDKAIADWAVRRLGLQPRITFLQAPRELAWRSKRTTYVSGESDRAVPRPRHRRMAALADDVVELPGGHSPQICAPRALAEVIAQAAEQ